MSCQSIIAPRFLIGDGKHRKPAAATILRPLLSLMPITVAAGHVQRKANSTSDALLAVDGKLACEVRWEKHQCDYITKKLKGKSRYHGKVPHGLTTDQAE
jgi:hypothetical protein